MLIYMQPIIRPNKSLSWNSSSHSVHSVHLSKKDTNLLPNRIVSFLKKLHVFLNVHQLLIMHQQTTTTLLFVSISVIAKNHNRIFPCGGTFLRTFTRVHCTQSLVCSNQLWSLETTKNHTMSKDSTELEKLNWVELRPIGRTEVGLNIFANERFVYNIFCVFS